MLTTIALTTPVDMKNMAVDLGSEKGVWHHVEILWDRNTGEASAQIDGVPAGSATPLLSGQPSGRPTQLVVRGRYAGASLADPDLRFGKSLTFVGSHSPPKKHRPAPRSQKEGECGDASLAEKMDDAWMRMQNWLFCKETSLIYDSIGSDKYEKRFEHLPFPEEITASLPNPLGWATGMEDCMLNAGMAIDACILRARVDPAPFRAAASLREPSLRVWNAVPPFMVLKVI